MNKHKLMFMFVILTFAFAPYMHWFLHRLLLFVNAYVVVDLYWSGHQDGYKQAIKRVEWM